jgi:hypothetical protein
MESCPFPWETDMALDDFLEPEVGVAVAVTAALASPPVRKVLRRGLVYGLAGLLMAGDKLSATAREVAHSAQQAAGSAGGTTSEAGKTPARPQAVTA